MAAEAGVGDASLVAEVAAEVAGQNASSLVGEAYVEPASRAADQDA